MANKVLVENLVSHYNNRMGKGLSDLQREILKVLEQFPAAGETGTYIGSWAFPKDIMAALGREPTDANRAAISKALGRLCERGLVAKAYGQILSPGKAARYARIGP